MFKILIARLLRLFPNQAESNLMVPFLQVHKKEDILIDTTVQPAYISCYYPSNPSGKQLPVYINLHGGAFIMNEKKMDDPYCRFLANQTGCVVINIDYAKAPEYPFPHPIEQCYEIYLWLRSHASALHIDGDRMMVGGQSSGGNIAAALCLLLKERGVSQPLLQVLGYPMLDFVTPHGDKPEPNKWRAEYPQVAHFLNRCYVPGTNDAAHPHASPVKAENIAGVAKALLIIPEHDAFSMEGKFYAEKLENAGVEVNLHIFDGCSHAFTHLGPREKAEEAWLLIAEEIKNIIKM
ncbi:acetyl esterase [Halobacillus dabanensis]|uniref:Acetyl esterase n=1 Tax=Halobacillus dabanensis TaxID=240302 RepID=A0A1I3TEQ6_HALDA|nr:alpha/beta hydrolase [Halobacillus dabanensis]SFJ69425.1 acetyl esterase [Halobacillus dabanensis]